MATLPFHRARRMTSVAMLVAFTHQLGAGECGCPKHNGWLQAGRTMLASPADLSRMLPPHGIPAWEENECEPGTMAYLCDSSRLTDRKVNGLGKDDAALSPQLLPRSVQGSTIASAFHLRARPLTPTLPVRAELQVFLI